MEEKKIQQPAPASAIKRLKEQNMLKKQRLTVILMVAAICLLVLALLVVNYLVDIYSFEDLDGTDYRIKKINGLYELCYKSGEVCDRNADGYYQTDLGTLVQIDAATGQSAIYAVVDTEGTEEVGYGKYVMMFKQLTYDASSTKDPSKVIQSIEVHNEFGGYTFLRQDGEGVVNNFVLKDHADAPYEKETFAQLAVACGYTLSMRRLDAPLTLPSGEVDLTEYGLAPEKRTKTVTDADGNETEVEYDYRPAWYVVNTVSGDSYKVTLGDLAVTGGGYYAMYEGRDTIYILGTSGFSDVLLKRVEDIVKPMLVYPMGSTTYFDVYDFAIYDSIEYDAIYDALVEKFGDPDSDDYVIEDEDAFYAYYEEMFDKYSHKACHFSYQDLTEREGSMYAYLPYVSHLDYAAGYYINSNNIDLMLYNLYETDFTSVEKLAPTDADLEKYGIDDAAYVISYLYRTTVNGRVGYIPNYVQVSQKNEDGIFYAYSSMYDMIVGVSESSFSFLEWEELAWYDQSYMQLDISHVTDVIIESPTFSTHFEIEDSASKYMTYLARSGKGLTEGETEYTIHKDPFSGTYTVKGGNKYVSPAYVGDYLIAPLPYTPGEAQSESFLFVETSPFDVDGDGENDATAYYYYNVIPSTSGYMLSAYVAIADNQGNKLSERTLAGEIAFTTEYFLTNSNYLYLTARDTYVGGEIDRIYTAQGRGKWGTGNFFVTAGDQYVLVDTETGKWSILDEISCNIYFGDKDTSRLASRAVEIPAAYDSNGKLTRHAEIYYPLTEEKLQYNEETGKIEVYDTEKKEWKNATYADCTIGIWNSGAYYVTEGRKIMVVNEETGDWGLATIATNETYVAEIIADGTVLDYIIKTTNHVGRVHNSTATDNFKQFYGGTLYASLEGMADLTEEQKAAFRQLDDFTVDSPDNPCQLKITILGRDLHGNQRNAVYRFYQYTERKSYITVELLSSPSAPSSSTTAYGNFYVLRSFADKIIEDARKIVNAEEVTAVTKY